MSNRINRLSLNITNRYVGPAPKKHTQCSRITRVVCNQFMWEVSLGNCVSVGRRESSSYGNNKTSFRNLFYSRPQPHPRFNRSGYARHTSMSRNRPYLSTMLVRTDLCRPSDLPVGQPFLDPTRQFEVGHTIY